MPGDARVGSDCCYGDCELEAPAPCEFTCIGTCDGRCAEVDPANGACNGSCLGQCQGICRFPDGVGAQCNAACFGICECVVGHCPA